MELIWTIFYFTLFAYLGISYFEITAIIRNKGSIIYEGIVVAKDKSMREFTVETESKKQEPY